MSDLHEPVIVAEFWANRRGEAARISFREFEGIALLDVRRFYTGREGKLLPTKKGLSIALRKLPDLASAITKAKHKARELGLLKPEGQP